MKTIIVFATLFAVVFTAAVQRGDQAPEEAVEIVEDVTAIDDLAGKINRLQ